MLFTIRLNIKFFSVSNTPFTNTNKFAKELSARGVCLQRVGYVC